jgi:hypothetical protein
MKQDTSTKLKTIIDKKFRTTYIGAIYAIEKAFGVIWNKELNSYVRNNEVEGYSDLDDDLLDRFADIRDEVLDIGNAQCRNLKAELDEYFEIKPRIFTTNFRIAIEEN